MIDPTLRIVLLLQVLSVVSYIIVPAPIFFSFVAVNTLLLLLFSAAFRAHVGPVAKLTLAWVFFLFLVGSGRVMGGANASVIWVESVRRLEFFLVVAFLTTLAYLYFKPQDYLRSFDRVRIPREVTYIFLSVITLIEYVRNMGQRQLHLLTIKGLGPAGISKRVRAYYRILAPLLAVLLSRQIVHSRSMFYRGFFDGRLEPRPTNLKLQPGEAIWITAALFNFGFSLLISLWLSK